VTRAEALELVEDTFRQVAQDRCVGEREHAEAERELREVLAALGCGP
jgi:hypothetical protein